MYFYAKYVELLMIESNFFKKKIFGGMSEHNFPNFIFLKNLETAYELF